MNSKKTAQTENSLFSVFSLFENSAFCAMASKSLFWRPADFWLDKLLRTIYFDRKYERGRQMVDRPNVTPVVSGLLA